MGIGRGIVAAAVTLAIVGAGTFFYLRKVEEESRQNPMAAVDRMEREGVPDFTVNDLQGKAVTLSAFKGRIVVVNLWATWCAPCVEEFPSMVKMAKSLSDKVVLVTVSSDKRQQDVLDFLKVFGGEGSNIHHLWDEKGVVAEAYGSDRLPETFVLSKDLKLVRKISNSQDWNSPEALEFLKSIP